MNSKILKTKTFWGGIAAIATGIGLCISGDTTQGGLVILGGLQTIFLRDAITKANS